MTALALLAPASARAQGPSAEDAPTPQGPAVGARILGTVLQIEPRVGYERGVLRVAGPRGYSLTKRFAPGVPVEADLVADAEERPADRAAAPAEGLNPAKAAPKRAPWPALPDGAYVYEVVLSDPAGGRQVHVGRFRVETGVAIPTERPRPEPPRTGGASASASAAASDGRVSEKAFTEADFIKIDDTSNDGTTFLTLDSDDSAGNPVETWGVFNRSGSFTIEECGDGSNLGVCQQVLFTLFDDQGSVRRVGIGTAAPAPVDLHIVSTDGSIRLEATSGSTWDIQEIGGGLEFFLRSPSIFRPSDPPGTKLFLSGPGDVGIGVTDPQARLHVGGSAIIEGDVALGSSRTIKHAIEPVEPAAVLAAVRELPLYNWKYEADPVQALHIGPMAEDVHAAFRVGRDDKHLSPGDSAGLALAAVQGVDAELESLRHRNEELTRRLAALERLVAVVLLDQAHCTVEPGVCD
jgi:hypothetical protein